MKNHVEPCGISNKDGNTITTRRNETVAASASAAGIDMGTWRHASLAAITKQSQSARQIVERPDQIEHAKSHQTTEESFQKMRKETPSTK